MSLLTASINSGSNGNCYYIGNDTDAILIDAGISCRETEKRMKLLGLSFNKIKAIFVSHEHTDHIRGVPAIAARLNIPVYITDGTLKGCHELPQACAQHFTSDYPVTIGSLTVTAFRKKHDAEDPHSFTVHAAGVTVGVFTDIGECCDELKKHFATCNAAYLESNYDEEMLEKGSYPYFLKRRIRGGHGHLSNDQALELFIRYRPSNMTHLFLSHLSKDNNCPVKVYDLFSRHAGNTNIVVASRYEQTELYKVENNEITTTEIAIPLKRALQMSLF